MIYHLVILFLVLSPLSIVLASDILKKLFHLNERIEKDIRDAQAVRIGDVLYISGRLGQGRCRQRCDSFS
jgi:hypothetical protein